MTAASLPSHGGCAAPFSLCSVLAVLFFPANEGWYQLFGCYRWDGNSSSSDCSFDMNLKPLCVGLLCVLELACCCHFLSRNWGTWVPPGPSMVGPGISHIAGFLQQRFFLGTRVAVLTWWLSCTAVQSPSLDRQGRRWCPKCHPSLAAFSRELPLLDVVARKPQVMEPVGLTLLFPASP